MLGDGLLVLPKQWCHFGCLGAGSLFRRRQVMIGPTGLLQGAKAGRGWTTDATHAREAGYGLTANRASSARQAGAPLLS